MLARGSAGLRPDLAGRRVVVSAGGTREELDPVRFLGNRCSGRQGYALARTAAARGAEVTLIAAQRGPADPAGAEVVRVVSARRPAGRGGRRGRGRGRVVMAAAVADFRPAACATAKIKKSGAAPVPIQLAETRTSFVSCRRRARPGQVIVGFAAETDDVLRNGRVKLAAKGCDLLVVNRVG